MKAWSPIFNFVAVFIMILMLTNYTKISSYYDKQFDQARLDYTVDKSTKAAMISATKVDNIELDYINMNSVVLSPGSCIDTFEAVMCYNYGMEPTERNKNKIATSICAFVLTDDYGYYLAELVNDDITPNNNVNGGDYQLRFGPKVPFMYTDESNGNTYTVAYSYYPLLKISSTGAVEMSKTYVESTDAATKNKIQTIVNNQINLAIQNEVERRNSSNIAYKFYLPSETTKAGVNPITGPSLMVIINNADYASFYKLDAYNVGGYKVQKKDYVVCFKDASGLPYYCYASQLPEDIKHTVKIEEYVETFKEACDLGYMPNITYLMNKRD